MIELGLRHNFFNSFLHDEGRGGPPLTTQHEFRAVEKLESFLHRGVQQVALAVDVEKSETK